MRATTLKAGRTVIGIAMAALVPLAPAAQLAQADTHYGCSGIGAGERSMAETVPHTLRLVFARPDGHYLGDVQTTVTDANGAEIVSVRCPGPWVLLDLGGGTYRISATFEGETKARTITVSGDRPQEQVFTF